MIQNRTIAPRGGSPGPRRLTAAATAVLLPLLGGGCISTGPSAGSSDAAIAVSPFPDRDRLSALALADGPQPVELSQAVASALATSPRVNALRAAVHRAAGNAAAAATAKSPELRFGFGASDEDSRGWARESETGSSVQTGTQTERTRETGFETGSSTRLRDGTLDQTSSRTQYTTEDTRATRTTSKSSRYAGSSHTADVSGQTEDGMRVGLRYYPPNPWLMAAAGGAARAERWMAQAELVAEEHALICDTVETALQIAYGERALRVLDAFAAECRAFHDEARRASGGGELPRADLLDARLQLASAEADRERSAGRLAAWRQKFRLLTGVDPDRVTFAPVEAGALCGGAVTGGARQAASMAPELARRRPDMLAAHWNRLRHEQEWKEARAAGYPWINHVEVALSRWDVSDRRDRTVQKTRSESAESSETSVERSTQVQNSSARARQYETEWWGPVVVDESEAGSSRGSSMQTGYARGGEYETGRGYATESSGGTSDGEEWWIGISVDLPVFEWCSRQRKDRHRALAEARRGHESGLARAEREIVMAAEAMRKSRDDFDRVRRSFAGDRRELDRMAAESATLGLPGRLEALRLRERTTEMAIVLLDRALNTALDELQFCRASGLAPGQPPPTMAPP